MPLHELVWFLIIPLHCNYVMDLQINTFFAILISYFDLYSWKLEINVNRTWSLHLKKDVKKELQWAISIMLLCQRAGGHNLIGNFWEVWCLAPSQSSLWGFDQQPSGINNIMLPYHCFIIFIFFSKLQECASLGGCQMTNGGAHAKASMKVSIKCF